ncbi:FAD-dependent monooxygenase [Allokutzneria oryzae]|uniref:FAD-dependent monooxygenase n=1 Tax=Allokutzneria oryzae TaxID=1378989 RepID=A0ABV6A3U1_9PSEU
MDVQVLIAGAGPTGLTLAIDLVRRGVTVRIVDKAATHFVGSRGKGLQPRTQEVLFDLGVLDDVLAAGRPYPLLRVHTAEGATDRSMGEPGEAGEAEPWMLGQGELEAILRAKLAEHGVRVELGTELTDFTQDAGGVTAVVDGERVRAAYLVGADGGHSFVRKHLGVGFVGQPVEAVRMIIADVTSRGLDRDRWHIWPQAQPAMIGMCPLPGGEDRFQLMAGIVEDAPELTEATLRALLHERTGRTDITLTDPTWTSVYRANMRMVDSYQVGRVLLAGDAAHVHPPTGGQGLNTGVQDAYNLGWKLAAVLTGAPEELLETYEEERLPIAAGVLSLSSALLTKHARGEEDSMRRGKETQQLNLSYRGRSLAKGEHGGDRVPDLPTSSGSLFELLRGPHFTLLALGKTHPDLPVPTHALPELREHYGCDYVLVRPDGYVGVSTNNPQDLSTYLYTL